MKRFKGRTALLIGLCGVVAVLAIVVGLIVPKAAQIGQRTQDVAAAQKKERTLQLRVEELRGLEQAAPRNRRRLAVLQQLVPETTELPDVLLLLNDAADNAAVDFMSVTPGNPLPRTDQPVSAMLTQITVSGGYFSVDEFLYRLERLPRVAKVTQLSLTPGSDTGITTLTVNLTAEFYTTDMSAGPGSVPGSTGAAQAGIAVGPTSTPSPTGA